MATFIGYAITMSIIYALINYLNNRDNTKGQTIDAAGKYVIKAPELLTIVYSLFFFTGIALFFLFLFVKLKKNPAMSNGNFIFALVVAGIGLFVVIIASKWRIVVDNNQMTVHKLLRKPVEMQIDDITAEVGSKSQLIVYKDGKKIVTIDALSDNYFVFRESLEKKNLIINK